MNLISNDCVGGELYKAYDLQYSNPFIWTVLPYKDWDKINFEKVKYSETPNYLFSWYMSCLVIDNKVNVYFPHHFKHEKYKEMELIHPISKQNGYAYCDMDKYLIETYNRRIERMKDSPVFIFSQENRNTEKELEDLLKLAKKNGRKLIFISSNKNLIKKYIDCENIKFLFKEKNEVSQKKQADVIKNNLNDFINN